jgi:hypothetical protein
MVGEVAGRGPKGERMPVAALAVRIVAVAGLDIRCHSMIGVLHC